MTTTTITEAYLSNCPVRWTPAEWHRAFAYFRAFYGQRGLYRHFFKGQPAVTFPEFKNHLFDDYAAAVQVGAFWEWATWERESVRDRILNSRGHESIGH